MHHPERSKDLLRTVHIERHSTYPLHQGPKHNEVDVAVDESRFRRRIRHLRECHAVPSLAPIPWMAQVKIRRQPGIVSQQIANNDIRFAVLRELRNILRDRIVQPNLALFHKLHHRGVRGNYLGQRRQIEDRVRRHRRARRLKRTLAECFAIDHLPIVSHD